VYVGTIGIWEAHGAAGAVTLQIAIEMANSTNADDLRNVISICCMHERLSNLTMMNK
jgi:hypothetical protein